jgi:hypothetical protein
MKNFTKESVLLCILFSTNIGAVEVKKSLQIMPGKIHESCFVLDSNESIKYSFTTTSPIAFNIHYHLGEQVKYPVKINSVSTKSDIFKATIKQQYCQMWTNNGNQPIQLKYSHTKN